MEYEQMKDAVQKRLKLTDRELDRLVASDKTGSKIEHFYKKLDVLPEKNKSFVQAFWHTPQEFFEIVKKNERR